MAQRRARTDAPDVTRRALLLLAVGLSTAAALAGFTVAHRGDAASFTPSASWNMYSPEGWRSVQDRLAARGFARSTIRVVAATVGAHGTELTLLAGRRHDRTCFAFDLGAELDPTICRLARPLTVAASPIAGSTNFVALVRADVASVVALQTLDGRTTAAGQALARVPGGYALGGGFRGTVTLVARDAHGTVLERHVVEARRGAGAPGSPPTFP